VSRTQSRKFRTVRAVLHQDDRFLLVVHHGYAWRSERWGLPGGRIESGEDFADAARRELREELSIHVADLAHVGDYRYKGWLHRVYGSRFDGRILEFDRSELLRIGWHSLDEVSKLAAGGRLHTGFEHAAILDFLKSGRTTV
jgi:8-oxo-dGTP pyrophosphatase MutT (NUDIX family)